MTTIRSLAEIRAIICFYMTTKKHRRGFFYFFIFLSPDYLYSRSFQVILSGIHSVSRNLCDLEFFSFPHTFKLWKKKKTKGTWTALRLIAFQVHQEPHLCFSLQSLSRSRTDSATSLCPIWRTSPLWLKSDLLSALTDNPGLLTAPREREKKIKNKRRYRKVEEKKVHTFWLFG